MAEIKLPNSTQLERVISLLGGDQDVYGIHWDAKDDVITRTGGAIGKTVGASTGGEPIVSDFDSIAPWSNMQRVVLNDAGVVVARHGDPTYVEDGTLGQVMVEIPKFYYRSFKTATGYQFEITPNKKDGFKVHHAFKKGSTELDRVFCSAFNGSIFDTSASDYLLADEQVADFTATTGDKLSSIAGAKPCSGLTQVLTIVNSRVLANNRGAGWQLFDFGVATALQMLLFIEFASFNSQAVIGQGVVNKTDDGASNMSENNGATSFLGNKSGRQAGTNGLTSISYRGVENFWGNIHSFVDGINIQNHIPFLATDGYASDKFTDNYESIGTNISLTTGYISDLIMNDNFDFGILGSKTSGSSSTRIPDRQTQAAGNRVAHFGGFWTLGLDAGFARWLFSTAASSRFRSTSARLCYKK